MSDVAVEPTPSGSGTQYREGHEADHKAHPTDKLFIRMAILLAIVTAIEVGWSYLPFFKDATGWKTVLEIGGLFLMMAYKFTVVAGTFMHLRFDDKLLTRVFYGGLFVAIAVYLSVLATFEIFSSGTPGFTP